MSIQLFEIDMEMFKFVIVYTEKCVPPLASDQILLVYTRQCVQPISMRSIEQWAELIQALLSRKQNSFRHYYPESRTR